MGVIGSLQVTLLPSSRSCLQACPAPSPRLRARIAPWKLLQALQLLGAEGVRKTLFVHGGTCFGCWQHAIASKSRDASSWMSICTSTGCWGILGSEVQTCVSMVDGHAGRCISAIIAPAHVDQVAHRLNAAAGSSVCHDSFRGFKPAVC
jgi:hypothetical protein